MRVLFISNLFPDVLEPTRGLDNACLVHELAKSCDVRVLALRPALGLPLGRPKSFQCRPEDQFLSPVYCRTAYFPKMGGAINHRLMARSMQATLSRICRDYPFDCALCAWVYPDGCAVARLADRFRFPFIVIAQGTDVHQYLRMPARRRVIISAMTRADSVVTRSGSLTRLLVESGVQADKVKTIYNGVDFNRFRPAAQLEARKDLGLPESASIMLFVGNLLPIKNPLLLVAAHAEIIRRRPAQPCYLVMLGDGPMREQVVANARTAGSLPWVQLPGRQPPAQVARFMQAANVLCVSSDNEGAPNVILEAFSCGLPVVATNVGGISELVCRDFLGKLVGKSDLAGLASALMNSLATPPQRDRISQHARQFSWNRTAEEYLKVLLNTRVSPTLVAATWSLHS